MTIVIPDARTPAGVKCWVRDYEDRPWAEHAFEGMLTASGYPFLAYSRNWRFCRLDDPVEGWAENTGTAPDVNGPIEIKLRDSALRTTQHSKATGLCWLIHCTSTDITHWRYPRGVTSAEIDNRGNAWIVEEPKRTTHPQADILRRIADGEELKDRLWALSDAGDSWALSAQLNLLHYPTWTFAVSDEPGVPPPLPRPMIQLRPGGPKYYQGETVAPGEDVIVYIARVGMGRVVANNTARLHLWEGREEYLRLGLVHLSEENYRLHMAALEDLLEWAHTQGGVK